MPRRRNRRRNNAPQGAPRGGQTIRLSGTDWLESELVSSKSPDGSLAASVMLSPLQLRGTHLGTVATAYERFRFSALVIEVTTRMPTTAAGGYLAGISTEPEPPPLAGHSLKRYIRALTGSVSAPWYQSKTVRFSVPQRTEWLYTAAGEDVSMTRQSQGTFLLAVDGAPTNVEGAASVSLTLKWTVELRDPAVPESEASLSWIVPAGTPVTGATTFRGLWTGHSGPFNEIWSHTKYAEVYMFVPELEVAPDGGGKHIKVHYARACIDEHGNWGFSTFSSLVGAESALPKVPSGDVPIVNGRTVRQVRLVSLTPPK